MKGVEMNLNHAQSRLDHRLSSYEYCPECCHKLHKIEGNPSALMKKITAEPLQYISEDMRFMFSTSSSAVNMFSTILAYFRFL
jgi:hypothetical protein